VELELIPALRRSGESAAEISTTYPGLTTFDAQWVHILNDMTPMIGTMSDNVANYRAVAALPPFALFPWFFVLPGLLVGGVAAGGALRRPRGAHAESSSDVPSSSTEGVT
jgi:hypothetical protein